MGCSSPSTSIYSSILLPSHMSIIHLSIYPPFIHLPINPSTSPSTHSSINPFINIHLVCIHPSISTHNLSVHLPSIHSPIYLPTIHHETIHHLFFYLFTLHPSTIYTYLHPSIYHLSTYPSIYLFIHLPIHPFTHYPSSIHPLIDTYVHLLIHLPI